MKIKKMITLPCPICDSKTFKFIFEKKEKLFYRCISCQFELQNPMPTQIELSNYYENAYTDGLYKEFVDASDMKSANAKYRHNHTKNYISGQVLDVGCSDGHFLDVLSNSNIDSEGIDISETAVNYCNNKGLKAYTSSLDTFNPKIKYETIIGFDVIEHVLDPNEFLVSIKKIIKNNGTLILSTPNKESIHRKLMHKAWYFYIPEEHLLYFDKDTIRKLLEKNGFQVIKQKRFSKPLTLKYGLVQFQQYNPIIYKVLKVFTSILPTRIVNYPIPFYIGEMISIAIYNKN